MIRHCSFLWIIHLGESSCYCEPESPVSYLLIWNLSAMKSDRIGSAEYYVLPVDINSITHLIYECLSVIKLIFHGVNCTQKFVLLILSMVVVTSAIAIVLFNILGIYGGFGAILICFFMMRYIIDQYGDRLLSSKDYRITNEMYDKLAQEQFLH